MTYQCLRSASVKLLAVVAAAWFLTAASVAGSVPLAPQNATPSSVEPLLVLGASIDSISPAPLIAGERFMTTIKVATNRRTSTAELQAELKVYLNAVEVQLAAPGSTAPSKAMPAYGRQQSAPESSVIVTLFGEVPPGLVPSGAAEPLKGTLSIVHISAAELWEIAREVVVVNAPLPPATAQEPPPVSWGTRLAAVADLPATRIAFFVLVAIVSLFVYVRQRRLAEFRIAELEEAVALERHRLDRFGSADVAETVEGPDEIVLPEHLTAALHESELVIVTGTGASVVAGLPSSRSLWLSVIDDVADFLPATTKESLSALVAQDHDSVVEPLLSFVGRDRLIRSLQRVLKSSGPSALHMALGQLSVRTFIDLNWDGLMREVLPKATVLVPSRSEIAPEVIRSGRLALIKPFGELHEPDGLALTFREMRRSLGQAPELERAIATLFATRTFLFVGVSLKRLEAILNNLAPELEGGPRHHVALVPADPGNELWEAGLGRRYGVQLISYSPIAGHRQLVSAVESLVAADFPKRTTNGASTPSFLGAKLTHVELSSIGVFKTVKVKFEPQWTLLLGDNGGGKSTILKSIALALAGNDPRAAGAAGRLLRIGAKEGVIDLSLGTIALRTTLVRDGQAVMVRSPHITPLQGGQVLVLGFPALRGVSLKMPTGAKPIPAADPSVADLLPLLEGTVDTRLDNLKQWLVNIAIRAEADPAGRDARMLDTFKDLLKAMVPGGGVEFSRVDRDTFQVLLKVNSVEVVFDAVSQGMSAILNWIGMLLQRLYDIYPNSPAPELENAIVLIDEIDAHLHPKWQRQLVNLTRDHFKNVQVIASSHSPLLAGAVKREELRVVARDPATGEIIAEPPKEDLSGQKAEDILVSSMFELPTTRSVEAENTIKAYFDLRQKASMNELTEAEKPKLKEETAKFKALNYGSTIQQKQHLDRVEAQIDQQLSELAPEAIEALNVMLQGKPPKGDAS